MPREQSLRIDDRPATETHGIQVGTQVVASPVDTYSDQGMQQKMSRLGNFLKAGQGLLDTVDEGEAARGASDAIEGKESDHTWMGSYERGYMSTSGAAKQVQDQSSILQEAEQRGIFEKDPQAYSDFKQEKLEQYTKGLQDGPMKTAYLGRFNGMLQKMDTAYGQAQSQILNQQNIANVQTLLRDRADNLMKPGTETPDGAFVSPYETLQEMGQGVSRPEYSKALQAVFTRYVDEGKPEAFELLKKTTKDGKSVLDDPAMSEWVDKAQKSATTQKAHLDNLQKQETLKQMQPELFRTIDNMKTAVMNGMHVFTQDEVSAHIGEYQVFPKYTDAEAFMQWQHEQGHKNDETNRALDAMSKGLPLWEFTTDTIQKAMDKVVGGPTGVRTQFVNAVQQGDVAGAAALSRSLIGAYATTGSGLMDPTLKRMLGSTVTTAPSTDPVTQRRFQASAELYRALPANLQAQAAEGDAKKLLDRYVSLRDTNDEATAYAKAYDYFTPAAEAKREVIKNDPDFRKKVASAVDEAAPGWWRTMVPGGTAMGMDQTPINPGTIEGMAHRIANEIVQSGTASDTEDVLRQTQQRIKQSVIFYNGEQKPVTAFGATLWHLDRSQAIEVPTGQASERTQAAFTYAIDSLKKENPGHDYSVEYRGNGSYTLYDVTNEGRKAIGERTLKDIVDTHTKSIVKTPEDDAVMRDMRKKVAAGTFSYQDAQAIQPTLEKLREHGYLSKDDPVYQKAWKVSREDFLERIKSKPQLALGPASSVYHPSELGISDTGPTSQVVNKWLNYGDVGVALTAAREGIRLKAYPDPNPQAGMNIGAGYNFNANAKTLVDDFKEAGIPRDRIDDIKAGRQAITADQASSLAAIAHHRASAQSLKVLDEVNANIKLSLTKEQKGVLADLCYQMGPANLAQYRKAISALQAGNHEEFLKESQVGYHDAQGQFVPDNRGNQLRASLLQGGTYFKHLLQVGLKANR